MKTTDKAGGEQPSAKTPASAAPVTKEKLQADLQDLQRQVAQAEQQAIQWQNKTSALVGAISYCQALLKVYGVETPPPAESKPVESKSVQRRKSIQQAQLPNGALRTQTGVSEAPKVE